jgi:REP element-mobilizing transposase RayT
MPSRKIRFHPGDTYHLYNRGNNRENIIVERENYGYLLHLVRRHLRPVMDILAYCVMPNHYHLLVRMKARDGSPVQTSEVSETSEVSRQISNAMMRFSVAYTKAINKRYGRVGALFQGPYQAKPVPPERLLDLSCYLHHNPVAAGLVEDAADWPYASARDYLGDRNGTLPTLDPILAHLPPGTTYRAYLQNYAAWQTERLRMLTLE